MGKKEDRQKMIAKALLLFALVLSVSAQTSDPQTSGGLKNGRFWSVLSETSKLYFVYGFSDAVILEGSDASVHRYSSHSTFGEIVKGINQFYEDPANALIPIARAMLVFTSKVNGESPEELARIIAEFRHQYAEGR